jgi:predicted phosphodiesterase
MATLYLAGSELPTFEPATDLVAVLHVSDIHLNPQAFDMMERLIDQFGIDAVADTGDLTDWGTGPEAELVDRIADLEVPYLYVRGNHDSRTTQAAVADQPNAIVLDGESAEVEGLVFWGIGDPRYTPDKSQDVAGTEQERAEAFAAEAAERLVEAEPPDVDVAMVHDQRIAADMGGEVPLVLAGHTHSPDEAVIEPPDDEDGQSDEGDGEGTGSTDGDGDDAGRAGEGDGEDTTSTDGDGDDGAEGEPEETLLLVEGSTGGAGLRGLQGEEPEPLAASVLYFDPATGELMAYDEITVAWLEDAGATIERHIVEEPAAGTDGDGDNGGGPDGSGTDGTDGDGTGSGDAAGSSGDTGGDAGADAAEGAAQAAGRARWRAARASS